MPPDSGRYAENVLAARDRYRSLELADEPAVAPGPTAMERDALQALIRDQIEDDTQSR